MFDSLLHAVTGSPWTYLLIAAVCAGDAVLPLFPSETIVIAAAVAAANGRLIVWLVAVVAALGAFAGDNASYCLGASGLRKITGRLFGSGKNKERLRAPSCTATGRRSSLSRGSSPAGAPRPRMCRARWGCRGGGGLSPRTERPS